MTPDLFSGITVGSYLALKLGVILGLILLRFKLKLQLKWNCNCNGIEWVYEEGLLNDKFHGKGKKTWNDGHVYEGDWLNGLKHGKGKFT